MSIMNFTEADEAAALKAMSDAGGDEAPTAPSPEAAAPPPPAAPAPPAEEEEIRVVEDAPAPPAPESRDNRPKKVEGDPESRIRQLTWERENEKRVAAQIRHQLETATARERALMVVAQTLKSKLESTSNDNHAVTTGAVQIMQQRVEGEVAAAKQAFAEAMANGDNIKAMEAMERLTAAKIDASQVQQIRVPDAPVRPQELLQFEQVEQALAQNAAQQAQPPQSNSQFDNWRRNNPWYVNEPNHPFKQLSLHAESISDMIAQEGIPVSSAEHFSVLQERLTPVLSQVFGGTATSTQPQQAQQTSPAAAPSPQPQQHRITVAPVGAPRAPTPTPRSNAREVSASDAATAKAFGVSLPDFVKGLKGIPL